VPERIDQLQMRHDAIGNHQFRNGRSAIHAKTPDNSAVICTFKERRKFARYSKRLQAFK
jgi:hypothetical protein